MHEYFPLQRNWIAEGASVKSRSSILKSLNLFSASQCVLLSSIVGISEFPAGYVIRNVHPEVGILAGKSKKQLGVPNSIWQSLVIDTY